MKFKVGDKVLYGRKKYIVTEVLDYNSNYTITDVEGYSTWALDKDLKLIKPTIDDLRDYMLEHFVDGFGDVDIHGLDFSEFGCSVNISEMKVHGDLNVSYNKVGGDLYQCGSITESDYVCKDNEYGGNLYVNKPKKLIKEITEEELAEIGYKLKENK